MMNKSFKEEIDPLMKQIENIAKANKIPFFASFMLSDADNNEEITPENVEYKNYMFSPHLAGISLPKNDYIAEYIKITNGFVAQPVRMRVDETDIEKED